MAKLGIILSAVCLTSTAVIWAVGIILKDDLRDSGADFAANLQDERDQSLVDFMTVVYWTVPFSLPIFFVVTLQTLGPLPGLKAIGMLSFSVYICALLRILIAWPQIYWARHEARGLVCLIDWALPSPSLGPLATVIAYFAWQMREPVRFWIAIPVAFLIAQYFVELYLGFSDFFTSLMSISFGCSLAVCMHGFDEYLERAFNYAMEFKIKGAIAMTSTFFLCIAVTFAIYEGRKPYLPGSWDDNFEDVCDDADEVSLDVACFTTCVIIALFYGAVTGSLVANILVKEPWWTDEKSRPKKILVTIAYIYLGFGLVFAVSIIKQSIRSASSDSFISFIIEDRYGYFTYFYGLITSYILGITLAAILPMFCHICFGRKREPLSIQINSR
mmetsp:Transcript_22787/g.40980  ORF Transcript_22787/g.40980 Transcript_22787/m.40980 type:complete len:387 (+) Transcript_22787:50-1210(+)